MRRATVTTSGVSTSNVVPVDYINTPFAATLAAVVTSTATYTIQCTVSDVFAANYSAASDTWFDVDVTALVAATASKIGKSEVIVTGYRINQTAGAGSVALTVLQGLQN